MNNKFPQLPDQAPHRGSKLSAKYLNVFIFRKVGALKVNSPIYPKQLPLFPHTLRIMMAYMPF